MSCSFSFRNFCFWCSNSFFSDGSLSLWRGQAKSFFETVHIKHIISVIFELHETTRKLPYIMQATEQRTCSNKESVRRSDQFESLIFDGQRKGDIWSVPWSLTYKQYYHLHNKTINSELLDNPAMNGACDIFTNNYNIWSKVFIFLWTFITVA